MHPMREERIKQFKSKSLEEQRKELIALIEPLASTSATYARLLPKINSTQKTDLLVRIMETIEAVTDKLDTQKKQQETNSFMKQKETISKLLEKENIESAKDQEELAELERILDQL